MPPDNPTLNQQFQVMDWEFWLDHNISPIIAKWLMEDMGLKVKSSYALDSKSLPNLDFFLKAKNHGKVIIVTKDTDFSDLLLKMGAPPKIIKIQTGNCDNKILYSLIQSNIEKAVKMLITFDKNIVEINNQKLP